MFGDFALSYDLPLDQLVTWGIEKTRLEFNIAIFITITKQVRSIIDKFVLLQSGSVFYKHAKLTSAQYKHRVIFTLDGSHSYIYIGWWLNTLGWICTKMVGTYFNVEFQYSGDLNNKLVGYSNSPKQFICRMVNYSSHVLNNELQ